MKPTANESLIYVSMAFHMGYDKEYKAEVPGRRSKAQSQGR